VSLAALIAEPAEEVILFTLPEAWLMLPEDMMKEAAYWAVVQAVQAQERTIPLGPPFNIEMTVADKASDLADVKIRHECDECQQTLEDAREALRESRFDKKMILCQFTQVYVRAVTNGVPLNGS
jgi:hypothetical protein